MEIIFVNAKKIFLNVNLSALSLEQFFFSEKKN